MKSFAFGAAAAVLAAYTIADKPPHSASSSSVHAGQNDASCKLTLTGIEAASVPRPNRGLPPFWGSKGIMSF